MGIAANKVKTDSDIRVELIPTPEVEKSETEYSYEIPKIPDREVIRNNPVL